MPQSCDSRAVVLCDERLLVGVVIFGWFDGDAWCCIVVDERGLSIVVCERDRVESSAGCLCCCAADVDDVVVFMCSARLVGICGDRALGRSVVGDDRKLLVAVLEVELEVAGAVELVEPSLLLLLLLLLSISDASLDRCDAISLNEIVRIK